MIFEHAKLLFDSMDADQKDRVTRIFDLTRAATPNVYDAFAQAVADVAYSTIERGMLMKQKREGAA